jgi:pSer/pThr/pTyr-binding forkhead associated (FHA) protein
MALLGRVRGPLRGDTHCILVDDPTVSRRHALIQFKEQQFWIIDQGSVNGTYVNGKRVVGQQPLKDRDRIQIAEREFEFTLAEVDAVHQPDEEASSDATRASGLSNGTDQASPPASKAARGKYDFPWTGNPASHYP